ncbi:MAG: type IV secretory system conjugative DNA transfer family protein [Lachnospiraceae bacterium]|nr:type IV secretory system conjugative DNA transfer family protein [Lachnospiraceae bacterium]
MGKAALTGIPDRNEAYKKNFITKIVVTSIGGLTGGILIGYCLSGGDLGETTVLEFVNTVTNPAYRDYLKVGAGAGFCFAVFGDLYAYTNYEKFKNRRPEEEHGSAKLMSPSEMRTFNQQFFYDPAICKKYDAFSGLGFYSYYDRENLKKVCRQKRHRKKVTDECFLHSQILGQDVYISMNTKFINRNLNTLTIGGSGQGKSYSELFPNALNANCNYIFTDPSGEIYTKIGRFLEMMGYELKVFNVDEFNLSMKYNPIHYVVTEKDCNILVDALNKNIKPDKKAGGSNEFFDDAKDSLICALIALVIELYPVITIPEDATDEERKRLEEQNAKNRRKQTLSNVMELLRMARQEMDEEGNTTSTLDDMFEKLRQVNHRSYAAKMWENFKVGGTKVCNEVIISAAAVFGRFFDTDEIAWLTMEDELHLEDLASEKKCALFLVIPQDTKTYNFMCSMIYSQLFSIATKAGKKWRDDHNLENPTLPRHLSFWLDEFANIGKIPSFMELLSVVRKYNISINIIVQGMAQLKALYPKDEWEIILANLDEMIYLGGMEPSTVKWLSEKLGKETIKQLSNGYQAKTGSLNTQSIARNLLDPNEIEEMSRSHELVFISGCKPIRTRKYDLSGHPNFKYCGEADPRNNLNIRERFKDSRIDYELLDESIITEDDIRNYDFSKLYLKAGHKRGTVKEEVKKKPAGEIGRLMKELKNISRNLAQPFTEKTYRQDYGFPEVEDEITTEEVKAILDAKKEAGGPGFFEDDGVSLY